MAIIGYTDKRATFPEIGTLRKGAPKTDASKPGSDLDYFRFDTDDEGAHDKFVKAFGDKPREIEVKLPYHTVDENFDAWREEYVASGLKHRCDGEKCTRWLKPDGTYSEEPIKCPGGCKQTGRLKIIIPALERFASVTVTTTSIWDIITIHQNLSALEMLCGSLRGIPMILCRREREISTPAGNGKRARRKKWLLSVEAKPEWAVLQLAAQDRAALQPAQALALPEWNGDEEIEEIEAEAEPQQMVSSETLDAINKLWPKHGNPVNGKVATFAEYLNAVKGINDPRNLTADEGHAMLTWLQGKALQATSKNAAPKQETVAV